MSTGTADDADQFDDLLLYSNTVEFAEEETEGSSFWQNLHLREISGKFRNWLIFCIILVIAHVVHNFTPPPAPLKLLQVRVF